MPPDLGRRQLLGRADELAALLAHLGIDPDHGPGAGGGRSVLVGGDAGMGKTRLLEELAGRAGEAQWRVMLGHCLDLADQLLPYLPFTELVGRFATEDPEAARQLAEQHPAVTALAPGRRLLSGDSLGGRQLERGEIFDGMHAALETLAREGPVLLVVEDLHWADQSTRDLLGYLLARPFQGQVGIVGSYRTDDLHRRHPLRPALTGWGRLPAVRRLQLAPLAADVVRRLVLELQDAPLLERDVAVIVARAEGNPFFAEELVGASQLRSGGAALPEDLAALLLLRLDQLDDAARLVVRAASCSGRRVDHALVAAVAELPEDRLESALRQAVESNVLVRLGDDGYGFRHALLAEAVHDDLLPGERVRLHSRYVAALTSGAVAGTAAELATHARAAHDVETAIRAGIRAGEEAMAVGGPDDAAKHFEAALEVLARADTTPEDVDVAGLVVRASEAVVATGQPGRAIALVRDHLASTTQAGRDRARVLLAWAGAALVNESSEAPLALTTEALRIVGEEPGRLRTRAISLHARALAADGRDEDAAKHAGEALAMAQRLDLPQVAAEAATTLATLDVQAGDMDAAVRALHGIVTDAQAERDTDAEMRGRYYLAIVHLERGRLVEAQELFGEAAKAAQDAGRPWAPYGFDARYHQAMTALLRGRWDEALAISDCAGESPPADPEAVLASVRMLVSAGRGEQPALRLYESLKPAWPREGLVASNTGAAAIDLLGARGDLTELWRVHDEVVEHLSQLWSPMFQARVRLSALVLGQLAGAAGRAPAHERQSLLERVEELQDVVDAVLHRSAARPRGFGPEGRAWVARSRAEQLRLRWLAGVDVPEEGDLLAAWQDATDRFQELGHVYEAARSTTRLAAVLTALGRGAEAAPLVAEARAVADGLGATPLLHELDELGPRSRRGVPSAPGLTPREREILALVALGRSNGAIGRQLFISTKTVSVHVSNVLAKLQASGRTEAVAIARRQGLLPD